jgi:hypothetical protein
MNYNLFLILNDGYIELGIVFLNSLFKNSNTKRINNIFIGDIGLCEENKEKIKKNFSKITFVNSGKNIKFKNTHDDNWIESITYKTKLLLHVVKNNNTPIIMLDSDMFVVDNFLDYIDLGVKKYDIQVCKREVKSFRKDKIILEYIASFFVINNSNGFDFMNKWIDEINNMNNLKKLRPYETPALCKILKNYKKKIKIRNLDENIISASSKYINNITKIIHMKSCKGSNNGFKNNLIKRAQNIKNYSSQKILNYLL